MRTSVMTCAIAIVAASPAALPADYTITTVDYPGAVTRTTLTGINVFGRVVGTRDGTDFVGYRGFTEKNSVYTAIGDTLPCRPVNGRCRTSASAINALGQIAGTFSADVDFPGVYLQTGSRPTIVQPPGYPDTAVQLGSLNNWGVLVGCYAGIDVVQHIFTQTASHFATVELPIPNTGACAAAINDLGQITGYYADSNGMNHAFVMTGNHVTTIDVPADWGVGTQPVAINDWGVIIGTYESTADFSERGFVWRNGQFSKIEIPAVTSGVVPRGINNRGEIVGSYSIVGESAVLGHSFLIRGTEVMTLPVPGTSMASGINDRSEIVGTYCLENSCATLHGFRAVPTPN